VSPIIATSCCDKVDPSAADDTGSAARFDHLFRVKCFLVSRRLAAVTLGIPPAAGEEFLVPAGVGLGCAVKHSRRGWALAVSGLGWPREPPVFAAGAVATAL
jgi:hypothetical protein